MENEPVSIVAGNGHNRDYRDLMANVRHDGKYHSVKQLVQPDDATVREVARELVKADDFIEAAQEFVDSFTTYKKEVGDYWTVPAEILDTRAGDCVSGDTPVWIRINGRPTIMEVRELLPSGDYCAFAGVEILTPTGFAPLVSVRRKGKRPTLNITSTSAICMTPEHKVVVDAKANGKDRYCALRDAKFVQLERVYPELEYNNYGDYDSGWAYGLFFADGTASLRAKTGGESWRILNANTDYLEKAANTFAKLYPDLQFLVKFFKSYRFLKITNFGVRNHSLYCLDATLKIDSNRGIRGHIIREFHSQFYNSRGWKKVPDFLLHGSKEMARGFWDGVHAGDGEKRGPRVSCKNKMAALGLAATLRRIGELPQVTPDHKSFRIKAQKQIKEMANWRKEGTEQEVFDIATGTGEFVAGDIAVKNCDDKAILLTSILRNYLSADQVYCAFGLWILDGETTGHMYVVTEGENGEDRIIEATAGPERKTRGRYILHGMFNDQYAFATEVGLREFDLKTIEYENSFVGR